MIPGLIQGGASLLGSLLGGATTRGIRKQAAQYGDLQRGAINNSQALLPGYQRFANDATADYNTYRPEQNQAIQNYARTLGVDKYTGDYSAARIGNATSGATDAYLAAKARIASSMAQRGISDSNIAEGARVGNENDYARTMSNAQMNLGLERADSREARQQALVNLLSGASQNSLGNANSAMGNIDNVNRYAANEYGNLAGQAQGQAQAQAGGIASLMGSLGGLAARYATPGTPGGQPGMQPGAPGQPPGLMPQLPPGYTYDQGGRVVPNPTPMMNRYGFQP